MRNGAFDAAPAMMRIGAPRWIARSVWSVAAWPMLSEPAASVGRAGDDGVDGNPFVRVELLLLGDVVRNAERGRAGDAERDRARRMGGR
jgi:hypothetical protein